MGKLALGLRGAAAARGTTSAFNLALTALALVLAAFALRPAGADAASVSVDKWNDRLVVSAGSGERNVLSVSVASNVFTVTDTGAPLTAGTGCSLVAGVVRCTPSAGSVRSIRVYSGDQDDAVAVTGMPAFVDAGPGADTVTTGASGDYVSGSLGDDVLDGGLGGDLISGGDGRDRVDYSRRTAALIVSLGSYGADGEVGEGDNVMSSVEDVIGGAGADRITGSSALNILTGGAGDDVLSGAAGSDTLDGNAGRDVLDGGADADTLRSIDDEVDDNRCGLGIDTVATDCETRRFSASPVTPAPAAAPVQLPDKVRLTWSGRLRVRVYCALTTGVCRGRLIAVIRRAGTTSKVRMAAARKSRGKKFSVKAGKSKAIDVKISRNGRRRVLKDKRTKCRISAVTTNGGERARSTKVATVEAPEGSR